MRLAGERTDRSCIRKLGGQRTPGEDHLPAGDITIQIVMRQTGVGAPTAKVLTTRVNNKLK